MLLETASDLTAPDKNGKKTITEDIIRQAATSSNLKYDKTGNEHYDTISAFIKSMRGSDPDATLYYLARMLESGEDINYIARRIVIHASEDVGLADDSVLPIAVAAMTAVHNIGMPEAQIILAHAALRIALAPKSNTAVTGIDKACQYVQATGSLPIPLQASDNHVCITNYIYPHDYEGHYVLQQYLPDQTAKAYKSFYNPCAANGHETELYERLQNIRNTHINALNGVNPT
jgi:putative ATPase